MAEEIKGKWAWEDYPEVQVKGYEEVPNMANQQRLADINKYLEVANEELDPAVEYGNKLAKPFRALGYGVRKYITDPVYKGVDVIAQKGGNKIAEMLGAKLSDKDKYGDIDFGPNGERQGFDSLDEYINAKEQGARDYYNQREALNDPMAWYADAQGGDVLSEPSEPDSRWSSLTGTKAYQDWQPDTMVGKVVKGASGIAGDMLPSNLEGYAIENAPKMLGTLSPVFKELKSRKEASKFLDERAKSNRLVGNEAAAARYEDLAKQKRGSFEQLRDDFKYHAQRRKAIEEALMSDPGQAKRLKDAKDTLSTDAYEEYLDMMERMNGNTPIFAHNNAINLQERLNPKDSPANLKSIARNARKGQPKPLPNPAAQSRVAKLKRQIAKDEVPFVEMPNGEIVESVYGQQPRWWSQEYSFKADPNGVIQDIISNSDDVYNWYDIPNKKQAEGIINQLASGMNNGSLKTKEDVIEAFEQLLADWWGYKR